MSHNYEEMTVEELNQVNDDLGRQIETIREERRKLNAVRGHKIKVAQVIARYKGKVKPEDVAILRELGALPPDEGQVIKPDVITVDSIATKVASK